MGGVTHETRSPCGVRIDDRGRGRYIDIPRACPGNRERYKWGHDFRPEYLEIVALLANLPLRDAFYSAC